MHFLDDLRGVLDGLRRFLDDLRSILDDLQSVLDDLGSRLDDHSCVKAASKGMSSSLCKRPRFVVGFAVVVGDGDVISS